MNYVVLDLEYNQHFEFEKGMKTILNVECPFEIIQIGAVVLDSKLNTINKRKFNVKPVIYERMHPIVEKITGIKMSTLINAKDFTQTYEDFVDFLGESENCLCVWGGNDIKEFYRNVLFYNLNANKTPISFIDVQREASIFLKTPSRQSIGLKNAVQSLSIEVGDKFHDALNDAVYTSEVFKKIYNPEIKTIDYNLSSLRQRNIVKLAKVNSGLLFRNIEKTIGKKLTDKEKELVLSIYNMGKNNKFKA